jgi:hypothetical protein
VHDRPLRAHIRGKKGIGIGVRKESVVECCFCIVSLLCLLGFVLIPYISECFLGFTRRV